jgi:hypothetical protein
MAIFLYDQGKTILQTNISRGALMVKILSRSMSNNFFIFGESWIEIQQFKLFPQKLM